MHRYRRLALAVGMLLALASLPRAAAAWPPKPIPYRSYCAAWMRKISRAGSVAPQAQGAGANAAGGGLSIWRYELSASAPAALSVELTMQTTKGWYRVTAPAVLVVRDDGEYRSNEATFGRYEVHSPAQFFELPVAAGRPRYLWVSKVGNADTSPTIHCPAMWVKGPRAQKHASPNRQSASKRKSHTRLSRFQTKRVNPSVFNPHAMPPVGGRIARAYAITEPERALTCVHPFLLDRVKTVTPPNFPDVANAAGEYYRLEIGIAVELGRKGQVVGLGYASPSGLRLFDQNALYAASQTTYFPKIGLCRPVPSFYIFDAQYATE